MTYRKTYVDFRGRKKLMYIPSVATLTLNAIKPRRKCYGIDVSQISVNCKRYTCGVNIQNYPEDRMKCKHASSGRVMIHQKRNDPHIKIISAETDLELRKKWCGKVRRWDLQKAKRFSTIKVQGKSWCTFRWSEVWKIGTIFGEI